MPEQDADVLHHCNHVILDSLPPRSSPSSALESVIVGCISKASFHEPFSSHPVTLRCQGLRLCPSRINGLLVIVPLQRSGGSVCTCALCTQRAGTAYSRRAGILICLSSVTHMLPSPLSRKSVEQCGSEKIEACPGTDQRKQTNVHGNQHRNRRPHDGQDTVNTPCPRHKVPMVAPDCAQS